jgi:uncharacterized protein with von Willebrand factor type A (vWA) domain
MEGLAGDANKELSAARQRVREAAEEIKQLLLAQQANLRRLMERAAGHAVQEVEAVDQSITSWGLDKGGFHHLPVEKKLALLSVLKDQKKFRDMGKLVGRIRNIAIASRRVKVTASKVELHSVTVGNDISRLLPQELVALRRPALKLDFYRRYTEKVLAQYDLQYPKTKGQGPIVCLVDSSGSMRKPQREEWSKAVALGFSEIAAREKRAFAYALFAGESDELISGEFISGRPTPGQLLALAQGFIGGGTDFEKPLTWGLDKVTESKFGQADIVLVTDGECAVNEEFLARLMKEKAAKGFCIYSILIDGYPQELHRFSDEVWSIHDLLDDNVVKELFEKL